MTLPISMLETRDDYGIDVEFIHVLCDHQRRDKRPGIEEHAVHQSVAVLFGERVHIGAAAGDVSPDHSECLRQLASHVSRFSVQLRRPIRFSGYSCLQPAYDERMRNIGGAQRPEQTAITGARLRDAREAAGLSLTELAAKIPYSRATLGHYETARRTATAEVIGWYEQICGQFTDPVTAMSVLGRADVDRRSFLRDVAYSAAFTATALLPVSDIARLAHITDTTRVGMADVDAVRAVTDAFLGLDEVRGGNVGRSAVAEFLATDVAALLRSRFTDEGVRQQAFSAASELAYHAGFKAHDAGQEGLSQRYFLSALRLAETSAIPGQDGFVFRILALHSNDVRRPQHSVELAERSVMCARDHVGPDTMALFLAALARCHAETGDKAQALATLHRAEPLIVPKMTTEQPRWAALFCPNKASAARQTAKAFLAVGDLAEAERYHHMSAMIWNPDTHTRIHALTLAETGLIRWRRGNHEDAAKLWRTAIPKLSSVNSERGAKVLHKIRRTAPEFAATSTRPSPPVRQR